MRRRPMTDRHRGENADEEEGLLDPETRAAFERSYERHRKAMERLAEL